VADNDSNHNQDKLTRWLNAFYESIGFTIAFSLALLLLLINALILCGVLPAFFVFGVLFSPQPPTGIMMAASVGGVLLGTVGGSLLVFKGLDLRRSWVTIAGLVALAIPPVIIFAVIEARGVTFPFGG
jgi:hypothetical protein